MYVLRQLCVWVRLRLMAELGELVARDLRDEVYEHLQTLSVSFFSRKKTGSLITRVSSDTDRLWEFLAFGVVEVSLSLVTLLGLGVILIALDPTLGLMLTLPVPLLCFAIYENGQRMERLFLRAWRKWSRLTDVLAGSFLVTLAILVPLTMAVGIAATHRVVGPLYRFRVYLTELAGGQRPGPCKIREKDELQDLCVLLNRATEPLRQSDAVPAERPVEKEAA